MPDYDYVGPGTYAFKDSNGNWRAGENSKKYSAGTFVDESYAKSVRGSINFRNRVKGLVANPSEDTPEDYNEARDIIAEFNQLSDEMEKVENRNDSERVEEIEREINELQSELGS